MLAIVDTFLEIPQAVPHEGIAPRLARIRDHSPAVKDTRLSLLVRGDHGQTMQPARELLLFNPTLPLGECFCDVAVPFLRAELVQCFDGVVARRDVVFPHVEAEFELSSPEIRDFAFNDVKLAVLLIFEAHIEHPLFKLSIEDQSLSVSFREELGDLPVLLQEHHRVARQLEPKGEGVLLLPARPMQ